MNSLVGTVLLAGVVSWGGLGKGGRGGRGGRGGYHVLYNRAGVCTE